MSKSGAAEIPRERRYASIPNTAEYADCATKTIRRLIASGELTRYRLGRDFRVDLNEVDALLEAGNWEQPASFGHPPINPRGNGRVK